jgi:ribosomal protein L29
MATKLDTRSLSDEQLGSELEAAQRDYVSAKIEHATTGLQNPTELRGMRKNIARLMTEARGRELTTLSPEAIEGRSKIRARRRK